ncbi:LCP family protein required for cell wall assembly [Deinococcus sp. HSC-46F16]|uniref:LCP family protein n=1 Tax=Deinococcus sp. HSC-46F16 TaxID=2910968 RepID=UPI0020A1E246|nr:LCP family protein required for cell wall assembly [Deinococcus sp. HSC-46F16]
MRRTLLSLLVVLAGFVALAAPAAPALSRYGALPRTADGPLNILLAGVDVEYDDSAGVWPYPPKPEDFLGRTDTIVLAQVHPDGQTDLLSIPRDTWVSVPGWGLSKINAANRHGGPEVLAATVQDLTGVRVDSYVLLSLGAVRALTDAAGGVTVDVGQRMKYDDNAGKLHIDLQPGRQRLSGEQAEGFLRFRKDNLGDIGRVQRQQAFLTALVNQTRNPLNWWRLPRMVGAMHEHTRSDLSRGEVGALLGAALRGPRVQSHTVPGDYGAGGTWIADRAALAELVRQHFRDPNDPRSLSVAVLNVGAPDGSAARMQARLRGLGYGDVTIANGPRQDGPTTLSGERAAAVQRDVGFGQVTAEPGVAGADVTVRLGSDTPAN